MADGGRGQRPEPDRDVAGGCHSRRHFARFGEIATQRPFAIDMLAGRQRGQDDGAMFGHLHRHRDDVDSRIVRERE